MSHAASRGGAHRRADLRCRAAPMGAEQIYLRRNLSAASAISPLSTPRAVTALPASISGTAGVPASALLARTSSAPTITMQYHFFMLYLPLEGWTSGASTNSVAIGMIHARTVPHVGSAELALKSDNFYFL